MKIALIQCPCWGILCPPYGLAVLAAYLRGKGYNIYIRDLNIEFYYERKNEYANLWDFAEHGFWINPRLVSNFIFDHSDIIDRKINEILNTGVEVIGISVQFSSEYMAKELARRIKEKDKEKVIIFGGPQASRVNSGFQLVELNYVDFIVQGEGEVTLEELINKLKLGTRIHYCEGIIYKKDGKIIDCGDRPLIPDLNSLPFADFSDFDFSKYIEPFRLPVSFSRGCPNRCIFCNEKPYWRIFRTRRAENIFKEIKYQIERIEGIDYIDFHDSLINGDIRELENLCDLIIADGLRIRWGGQVAIRKEMAYSLLLKMKKAGCICLNFGLETASLGLMRKIGKVLSKGADLDKIISDTHNVGIECILNFMFGFPQESKEDFQKTLDFLARNKDYIDMVNPSPGFCVFDKGSYAYEHPEEFSIVRGECGALWESKDGKNNYAARMQKFEKFLEKTQELGIKSFYPYIQLKGRDTVLGHYYFMKREWRKAIIHLKRSVEQQPKNESSWIYLTKSLISIGKQNQAIKSFNEVIKIRLSRKDDRGIQEAIEEARNIGLAITCSI